MPKMKLLQRGAEANIYCKNGIIVKERIAKSYREKALDEYIRKTRTKAEAKLLLDAAKAGIFVPKVISAEKYTLELGHINGKKVKDIISAKNMRLICEHVGESVAKLHNNGIIHGDLTTSNMILKESQVYFIDFGLGFYSKKAEDMATDINLLKEAFESTHYEIAKDCFDIVLESYRKNFENNKTVLEKLKDISLRGRYVKRKEGE